MIDVLYDAMAIPEACQLGKRVFKRLFHENAELNATDKKAFQEDIDTIIWQYTLKPNTIPIQAYEDDQREYLEVAVLQVDLKTQKRIGRIAEVMHRAIPYPLVVVFAFGMMCALSLAHKRFSQAEKGAIVAEEFIITDWIDLSAPTPVQQAFLDSLAVSTLSYTHFFAFYSALVDRCIAVECARLSGEYRLESAAAKLQNRREQLAACHELEVRIAEYKTAIKKEAQFNRQVELNTKIKELEKQLRKGSADL
ncbi:DUF4391 domain-containing protein [Candidatus Poribacteria bacterium]